MDRFDAAAKWWRDVLMSGAKMDNGDRSEAGALGKVLYAAINARIPRMTEEQADLFQATLSATIRANRPSDIYIDYHPCGELADAYKAATGRVADSPPFPIKTCMWLNESSVTVRYGYGAPTETVWAATERPS